MPLMSCNSTSCISLLHLLLLWHFDQLPHDVILVVMLPYLWACYPTRPAPLISILHGCRSSFSPFALSCGCLAGHCDTMISLCFINSLSDGIIQAAGTVGFFLPCVLFPSGFPNLPLLEND